MPKVSVIIPVYGVEKYIERCARSLFEQTLDDIEYLFIDDCTPDCSIEILKQVLEEYPQRKPLVVIHHMKQNSGQAKVRKWGMENATGEYVIHCDSDDWVDRDMYRAMYEKAKEENADVVLCQYARTDGTEILPDLTYFNENTLISDMLLEKTNWSLCSRLCKKELYSDIHYPTQNMGEDFHIVVQISLKSHHTAYIPRVYYYYYSNPNSICKFPTVDACLSRYNQTLENFKYVINKLISEKVFVEKSAEILNIKNHCRFHLVPYINMWSFYRLWLNTYPEINIPFAYVKGIPIRQRLRFYSRLFGLYPVIARYLHG